MSILDYFDMRNKRQPRPAQAEALLQIERNWDMYDIFVVNAPTASGKTLVADCISTWRSACGNNTHVVVPDNLLLEQAEREVNHASKVMRAKRFYKCRWKGLDDRWVEGTRENCPNESCRKRFTDGCPYTRALNQWKKAKVRVANYWMPGAHKMIDKCDVMIVDEAHSYQRFLAGLAAKRLWHKEFNYPLTAENYGELRSWVIKEVDKFKDIRMDKKHPQFIHYTNLMILWNEISQDCQKYSISNTEADYRGEPRDCIELKPIAVSDAVPLAISPKCKKLVLMSATVSKHDITDLGFSHKRVLFVNVASPIPVDRRPIFLRPCLSNRSVTGYKDASTLLDALTTIAGRFPEDKGVVHCTYDMAKHLQKLVCMSTHPELLPRLVFHDKFTKRDVLAKFMASSEPQILVACGMTEGVDFKEDKARFQIIAKIVWPNLIDPVNARLAEENPDAYAWIAARMVMQAAGRVCRDPNDYGETYIFDSSYGRIPKHLWLDWYQSAVRIY